MSWIISETRVMPAAITNPNFGTSRKLAPKLNKRVRPVTLVAVWVRWEIIMLLTGTYTISTDTANTNSHNAGAAGANSAPKNATVSLRERINAPTEIGTARAIMYLVYVAIVLAASSFCPRERI